jgi:hypothetical protein
VFVNQAFFVISSVIDTLSIAPLAPLYMAQWHRSLSDIALLVRKHLLKIQVGCLSYNPNSQRDMAGSFANYVLVLLDWGCYHHSRFLKFYCYPL